MLEDNNEIIKLCSIKGAIVTVQIRSISNVESESYSQYETDVRIVGAVEETIKRYAPNIKKVINNENDDCS